MFTVVTRERVSMVEPHYYCYYYGSGIAVPTLLSTLRFSGIVVVTKYAPTSASNSLPLLCEPCRQPIAG